MLANVPDLFQDLGAHLPQLSQHGVAVPARQGQRGSRSRHGSAPGVHQAALHGSRGRCRARLLENRLQDCVHNLLLCLDCHPRACCRGLLPRLGLGGRCVRSGGLHLFGCNAHLLSSLFEACQLRYNGLHIFRRNASILSSAFEVHQLRDNGLDLFGCHAHILGNAMKASQLQGHSLSSWGLVMLLPGPPVPQHLLHLVRDPLPHHGRLCPHLRLDALLDVHCELLEIPP
mmetsp:Transcript_35033/g.96855  ORF Transcript_35033/g.96855 Transcript_35033/m.96855 type:complete len:230 (+) Transcript_35033:712-1401(+)